MWTIDTIQIRVINISISLFYLETLRSSLVITIKIYSDCFACMYVSASQVCNVPQRPEEGDGASGTEVMDIVSCYVGAGYWTWVL